MLLFKLLNWDMSNIKNESFDVFNVNTLMIFKMLSFLLIVGIFSAIFEHFIICPLIIVLIIGMGISVVCMTYGKVLTDQNLPKPLINDGVTLEATEKGLSISAITSKATIRWVDIRKQVGHADELGW